MRGGGRVPGLRQTEAEFRDSIQRVMNGSDASSTNPQPKFDPKQAGEFREECLRGRKEEAYVKSLEHHGFAYFTDAQLVAAGQMPTGQGMWRHPNAGYGMAYTPDDVVSLFLTPEDFDRWVTAHKAGKKLEAKRRKGLVTAGAALELRKIIRSR